MTWIDFEGRKPTDTDIPNWKPWSANEWDAWEKRSQELLTELTALHNAKQIVERNELIDKRRDHWDKLKPWLSALSGGKCWFTDSTNAGSHMDVEHFRPKKVARESKDAERDGYWWLAFDYTNYRLAGTVPNRMKGGWFPLHGKSCCSHFDARCEQSEDHLLLDPTRQTDVNLIAFDEKGAVIAAPGTDAWGVQRVENSVDRYKLDNHDLLVEGRRTVWQDMTRAINRYLRARATYHPCNPAARATMESEALSMRRMIRRDANFSSVALWCVQFRNDSQLLRAVTA